MHQRIPMPKPHAVNPDSIRSAAPAVDGMLLAFGLAVCSAHADTGPDISSSRSMTANELVSTRIDDADGFAWNSRFRARTEGGRVKIELAIELIPTAGVSSAALVRARERWRMGIEDAWGSRYGLRRGDGLVLPIEVRVRFHGPQYDHRVIVYPGRGPTHQLRWHLNDPPEIAAHEAGHMLGAYDEYPLGARDPRRPMIDPKGIMSANPVGTRVKPRHLERVRAWYAGRIDDPTVAVVPLAEASSSAPPRSR
jgi:hypothetical protein